MWSMYLKPNIHMDICINMLTYYLSMNTAFTACHLPRNTPRQTEDCYQIIGFFAISSTNKHSWLPQPNHVLKQIICSYVSYQLWRNFYPLPTFVCKVLVTIFVPLKNLNCLESAKLSLFVCTWTWWQETTRHLLQIQIRFNPRLKNAYHWNS